MELTPDSYHTAPATGRRDWRPDLIALGVLALMIGIVCWHRFVNDNWLSRHDLLSFFIPWYGYLGDRLSQLQIPAWNPYLFSGAPFAGDPESGWMYLPAMLTFPFFEVTVAFKAFILVQLVIAGFSTYALGRVLGMGALAALLSATIYAFGPFLYGQTDCCTVGTQTETWIPLALLGIELAFRAKSWPARIAWWFVGGLAISQLCAAWLGQGLFDAMLLVGAWVLYRGMISPAIEDWSLRQRVRETVTTGLAVLVLGLALGAAGILPKLAFNAASTNPGGTYEGLTGAWDQPFLPLYTLTKSLFHGGYAYQGSALGGLTIVLALLGIVMAGRKHAAPFFFAVTAVIYMLAMGTQPVLWLFNLIPGFREIHVHSPGRIIWLQMIGPAMLAGAALSGLLVKRGRAWLAAIAVLPLFLVIVVGVWFHSRPVWLGGAVYIGAALATLLVLLILCLPMREEGSERYGRWTEIVARSAAAGLIAVAFALPAGKNIVDSVYGLGDDPMVQFMWGQDPVTQGAIERNLARTDPGTAAEFLQNKQESGELFRYVGYGGNRFVPDQSFTYPDHRLYPGTMAIMTNGRPFRLGLQQTQGYDPLHLKAYADFITALNGQPQNYHYLDLMAGGAQSPLLDMLNVRYIVVAADIPADRADVQMMAQGRKEVYRDSEAVVYENPKAYTRAWIVHDVRPEGDGAGLAQLASGKVDGRQVAFVKGPIPPVEPVSPERQQDDESATVTSFAPEKITIQARADAPGLLVVSEIYDKGWKAYVDGKRVDLLQTNGALRGVPLPAGEHTVELRYEPVELRAGMAVSGVAGVAMLVSFAGAGWYAWRRPKATAADMN
ncbi:MAG: YfhO family protein [Thermomicrobiales bacterium]